MATSVKRKAADLAADAAKKPKADKSITSFFGPPKRVASTDATNPARAPVAKNFDKDAWVKNLTDEQRELLKLEIETLHEAVALEG